MTDQPTDQTTEAPAPREPRSVVLLDLETSGLQAGHHVAVEVAWWNTSTGESGLFLPRLTELDLERADPEAMAVNGYTTRLAGQPTDDGREAVRLHRQLRGNTVAGANPGFDMRFLAHVFVRADREACFDPGELGIGPQRRLRLREPQHHRMVDVQTATATALGLPWNELPSLHRCCALLGVVNDAPHTAMGDLVATEACLRALDELRRGRGDCERCSHRLDAHSAGACEMSMCGCWGPLPKAVQAA